MDAKTQDLFNRFTYHPPSPASIHALREIRAMALKFADQMVREVPAGREQALALTKLEEAVMWANAGIVRHQTEPNREDGVVMEATPPAKSHEEALRDYAEPPLEPVEPKLWKRRARDRGKEADEGNDAPMSCVHDKVYSPMVLMSDPSQTPWICRKCGAEGVQVEKSHPGLVDTYELLVQQFHGKGDQDEYK